MFGLTTHRKRRRKHLASATTEATNDATTVSATAATKTASATAATKTASTVTTPIEPSAEEKAARLARWTMLNDHQIDSKLLKYKLESDGFMQELHTLAHRSLADASEARKSVDDLRQVWEQAKTLDPTAPPGPTGPAGELGRQGLRGIQGERGTNGPTGPTGPSHPGSDARLQELEQSVLELRQMLQKQDHLLTAVRQRTFWSFAVVRKPTVMRRGTEPSLPLEPGDKILLHHPMVENEDGVAMSCTRFTQRGQPEVGEVQILNGDDELIAFTAL